MSGSSNSIVQKGVSLPPDTDHGCAMNGGKILFVSGIALAAFGCFTAGLIAYAPTCRLVRALHIQSWNPKIVLSVSLLGGVGLVVIQCFRSVCTEGDKEQKQEAPSSDVTEESECRIVSRKEDMCLDPKEQAMITALEPGQYVAIQYMDGERMTIIGPEYVKMNLQYMCVAMRRLDSEKWVGFTGTGNVITNDWVPSMGIPVGLDDHIMVITSKEKGKRYDIRSYPITKQPVTFKGTPETNPVLKMFF